MYIINQHNIGGEEAILVTVTPTASFTVGFNLTFTGSIDIDFKEGAGKEALTSGVEKTNLYEVADTYIIEITGDLENITQFIADSSRITLIDNLKTGLLTNFRVHNNLLSGTLDMSLAPVSGTFYAYSNSSLTDITFASSGNSIVTSFRVYSCDLTNTLDLSNLPVGTRFEVQSNPNLTDITFSNSGNSKIVLTRLFSCGFSGNLDLSLITIGATFQAYSNSSLTGITFASSGNTIVTNFDVHSCDLTGTLDLSNVPTGVSFGVYLNPNLTDITFSNSGNSTLNAFLLRDCNLDYINTTNHSFAIDNGRFECEDNSMIVSDVNHILVDLYSLVSGEGVGGDYTGRIIDISGTNAAPDSSSGGFDGDQAVIDLTAKGFTVTTS